MVRCGKNIEKFIKRKLPKNTMQYAYFALGVVFLIAIPSVLFTIVEGQKQNIYPHSQSFPVLILVIRVFASYVKLNVTLILNSETYYIRTSCQ